MGLPEGFNEAVTIETITGVVERILECIIFISLELIFTYQSKLTEYAVSMSSGFPSQKLLWTKCDSLYSLSYNPLSQNAPSEVCISEQSNILHVFLVLRERH